MASDAFVTTDGRRDEGFTLIEVLFAVALMLVVAVGAAQMFVLAIRSNQAARHQTSTTILAIEKMEQIRGLTWGFDEDGLGFPVSDTTTDLSTDPVGTGGGGLNPSPSGTLDSNVAGYVDYLDGRGNWVGTGSTPPPTAVYIRRWSIQPLPTNPNNTLVLQVLVTTVLREIEVGGAAGNRRRYADDALISTVKTRKAR